MYICLPCQTKRNVKRQYFDEEMLYLEINQSHKNVHQLQLDVGMVREVVQILLDQTQHTAPIEVVLC